MTRHVLHQIVLIATCLALHGLATLWAALRRVVRWFACIDTV